MRYIVSIDCGIDNVPYKNFGIKSQLNLDEVERILNESSARFKINVRCYCSDIDSNKKFYNLEDAIIKVINIKFDYVTEKRDFIDKFDRVEDGVISHDKILNKIIVVKDGIAYYKTTKCEKHKCRYIVPNTNNDEDIIVKEM